MQGRTTVYRDFYVTSRSSDLERVNYYIVTVPTPTDKNNRPVSPVKASETIGKVLKPGDIVIYESTVYPGATEEDCVPVLERFSGITFKENCPDIRNTRVVDIVHELQQYGTEVDIYDPWANPQEVMHEYNLEILHELPATNHYDAAILAVAHTLFTTIPLNTLASCIYDIKNVLPPHQADRRL